MGKKVKVRADSRAVQTAKWKAAKSRGMGKRMRGGFPGGGARGGSR